MSRVKRFFVRSLDVTILAVVVATVWLLLLLPLLLYFVLKDDDFMEMSNSTSRTPCSNKNYSIKCREDFFYDNNSGQCRPHCEKWNLYSGISVTLSFAIIGLSTAAGLVTTVIILILSIIKFRNMFKFPSVMVIYQNAVVSVYGSVVLIGMMDRGLFCPSQDLVASFSLPATPLCAISSFLLVYTVLPLAIWIAIQIAFILIGVYFPIHGQRFLASPWKRRTLHAFAVLLGLTSPVPTIVLLSVKGHSLFGTTFPPVVCTLQRRDIMIYTWMVPLTTLLSVVITMLIFIFYKVTQTKGGCIWKRKESNQVTVTVEVKVLIIAFSYIFIALVAMISFALSSARLERVREEVYAYFECESCGINSESEELSPACSRSGFEQLTNSTLATVAYSVFGLYSLVTMVYVIRVSDLKKCGGMLWKRFRTLKSSSTMMSQMASEDNQ